MINFSKTYAIPKYWVWLLICTTLLFGGYKVHDWWTHLNWPPADPRNYAYFQELTKKMGCDKFPSAIVTREMIEGDTSGKSFVPIGIDRKAFFEFPSCVGAGIYVLKEGTGVRDQFDVFDMTTKRRTARFTITHESFNQQ